MIALEELRSQIRALKKLRHEIKRLTFRPYEAARMTLTADLLEARLKAQWSVCFGAFLRQVNGRGVTR